MIHKSNETKVKGGQINKVSYKVDVHWSKIAKWEEERYYK